MKEKVSVVIATLGRADELDTALESSFAGETVPDEVIIVDGDPGRSAEPVAERFAEGLRGADVIYLTAESGLPAQRNAGLRRATGEVVLFLDDDVVLERDYLPEILSAYSDPRVGGACGIITNQVETPPWLSFLQGLFLLTRYAPRCYQQRSGLPTYLYRPRAAVGVDALNGCNMSFRRIALDGFLFDGRINYFDDDDVSLTVGRDWRLVQVPTARLEHVVSPKGRPRAPAVADRSIIEQRLLHLKHLRQTPLNVLAYYWSVVGASFVAFLRLRPAVCLRTLLGLAAVLTGAYKRL